VVVRATLAEAVARFDGRAIALSRLVDLQIAAELPVSVRSNSIYARIFMSSFEVTSDLPSPTRPGGWFGWRLRLR